MVDVVPPGSFLVVALAYTLWRFAFPWTERGSLWGALLAVAMPWSQPSVSFFHIYVGDVMTSLLKALMNLAFTAGFVLSGDVWLPRHMYDPSQGWHQAVAYKNVIVPIVVLMPHWFRFIQCLFRFRQTGKRFPNLYNGGKHGLMMTVTVFGAMHPLYTTVSLAFNSFLQQ